MQLHRWNIKAAREEIERAKLAAEKEKRRHKSPEEKAERLRLARLELERLKSEVK